MYLPFAMNDGDYCSKSEFMLGPGSGVNFASGTDCTDILQLASWGLLADFYQINHFRGIYDIRPYQCTYIKQVVIIRTPFFTLVLDITLICKQEWDLRKGEASEHDIRLLITAVTKAMSHSCVK